MDIKTVFWLLLLPTIFGGIGAAVALYLGTYGLLTLVIGCVGGLLLAEWQIPGILKDLEVTGMLGDSRTPEQERLLEQEKRRGQMKQNLSVVIGLTLAAILRSWLGENMPFILPALFGGLAVYFFRWGWLAYQKRGRLGP